MYRSLNVPPLRLNLDLVTSENQAYSQRKGALIFTQLPLRTNDGKTLSGREAGNNFHPPQNYWDLAGIIYHQHRRENFGESGEGGRHRMFAVSLPNATNSPTEINLERTWLQIQVISRMENQVPNHSGPLNYWSLRETPSSSQTCYNKSSSSIWL